MSHLNYFEPYQSKAKWHEDQLTRAYLIVLRYSPSALFMFYDKIYNSIANLADKKRLQIEIPVISELDLTTVQFETQVTDLRNVVSNRLISVLITDEKFEPAADVTSSDRGARYDGVISFSRDLALIIENKPRSYNVWEEQLSPNLTGLSDGIEVTKIPAIIEWKEIIKSLTLLKSLASLSGAEKIIINDFLDYIDINFPFLNPYDNLSLSKNNYDLLLRRIKNIFLKLALREENVKYHQGWSTYYLETGFEEIKMIGLEIKMKDNNWENLNLSLYFGDTLNQSRFFYKHKMNFDSISRLIDLKWRYIPNFHISHIQKHLIWFDTPEISKEKYFEYWTSNIDKIKQYSKSDLLSLLEELNELKLIEIDTEKKTEINENIINSNRRYFNICPGFALIYPYSSEDAIKMDLKNELAPDIKRKIQEVLGILPKKIEFLK